MYVARRYSHLSLRGYQPTSKALTDLFSSSFIIKQHKQAVSLLFTIRYGCRRHYAYL
jgi:hypothetical protein